MCAENLLVNNVSNYYYGHFADKPGVTLLANKPIVVWSKHTGAFHAFDNIAEADAKYVSPGEDHAYFWTANVWNRVDFFLQSDGEGKVVKGFQSR